MHLVGKESQSLWQLQKPEVLILTATSPTNPHTEIKRAEHNSATLSQRMFLV